MSFLASPTAVLSTALFAIFVAALTGRGLQLVRVPLGPTVAVGAAVGLLLGGLALVNDGFLGTHAYAAVHLLDVAVPLTVAWMMAMLRPQRGVPMPVTVSTLQAGLLSCLLVWNVAHETAANVRWHHYLQGVEALVMNTEGVQPLQQITMPDEAFVWPWTMPGLSMLAGVLTDNRVHGLLVKSGRGLQQFDPYDFYAWPDLRAYHVIYPVRPVPAPILRRNLRIQSISHAIPGR